MLGLTSTSFAEEAPAKKDSNPIKIRGKVEYTYSDAATAVEGTGEKTESTSNSYVLQLDASAKINANWAAKTRIKAKGYLDDDKNLDPKIPRVWVEGDYGNLNIRLGKMALLTNEGGLVWDTDFSGAQVAFGNVLKCNVMGGLISSDKLDDGVLAESTLQSKHVALVGINLQYENYPKLFGGLGYYRVTSNDLKTNSYMNNILSANLGYIFSDKFVVTGSYANNVLADGEKYSWQAAAVYGNYGSYPEKGDWSITGAYRQFGAGVSFAPTAEETFEGSRGWVVGVDYAPLKNIGIKLKYFKGKDLDYGTNVKNIWGRAEFFF